MFGNVENDADSSHEVDNLICGRIPQIVSALVASVAIDPLESQLRFRSCFVRHFISFVAKKHQKNVTDSVRFSIAQGRHCG